MQEGTVQYSPVFELVNMTLWVNIYMSLPKGFAKLTNDQFNDLISFAYNKK